MSSKGALRLQLPDSPFNYSSTSAFLTLLPTDQLHLSDSKGVRSDGGENPQTYKTILGPHPGKVMK